LQRVGHTLKGALGSLAAPIASRLAGELESIGMSGETSLGERKVNDLDDEAVRVILALESLCLETVK
jgi:two-component system, sensor histidine kinase and response regulator